MLEIILIIFIGRKFYELAKKYKQQFTWAYFIVGLVVYLGSAYIAGLLIGIYQEISGHYFFDQFSDLMLTVIFIPFALLGAWGVYSLLKKKWHKEYLVKEQNKPKISDIGKSEDEIASNHHSF